MLTLHAIQDERGGVGALDSYADFICTLLAFSFVCLFVLLSLSLCCLFLPLVSPIGPPFTHLRQPERSVTEFCPDLSLNNTIFMNHNKMIDN